MKPPPSRWSLIYAAAVFVALALGWNAVATRFDRSEIALMRVGDVFDLAARDLALTLDTLPAPAAPRIALYGSSQVANVKGGHGERGHNIPYVVQRTLAGSGMASEVVNFSDGGQQVMESLVIDFASQGVAKPEAIVIGLSLFSMLRIDVRPTLTERLDLARLEDAVRAAIPDDAAPSVIAPLFAWGADTPQVPDATQQTIQQRVDERIGDWLSAHVAAFANRQVMFNDLVDTPIRRDLSEMLRRKMGGVKRARTYDISSAYSPSILALEVMQRAARQAGIPMLVVLLPYDDRRPPTPFSAATQQRLLADLEAASARSGFQVLDLSHVLGSEHFGDFEDGSPDNLHFDEQGHVITGQRIAERLLPLLRETARAGSN